MAKVGTGVLKQWQDGETIHAVEYNNERNLIVDALNDTQEQVDTIKNTASVGTSMIQNLAVTTDKLANNSVTTNKISDAAVTTAKLADESVTEQKIATNAITETKIGDSAVTSTKIAPASVTSDKLAPTSVTSDKVSAGAVTTDKIFNGAVTQTKIADGAISSSKLADGSVVTTKIADESVSSSKLAIGAVTPDKIVKESVTQFSYDKNETDVRIANAIAGGIPQTVLDQIKTEVTEDISDIVAAVGDISILPAGMGLAEAYTAVNEDLYMHKNNADVHVTAQEKTAWNAKETTTGAQAKADAALQNSKNYVNGLVNVGMLYGTTTGSANTYALAVDSNIVSGALSAGLRVSFKVNVANTGSSTLNVNGLGAKTIKKSNGNNLSAGNLVAGSVYTAIYDGTNFILQGEGGEYGTATAGDVRSTKTIGTNAGLVSGSLVTRATSAITVTPTTTAQVLQPGIYDGTITIPGVDFGSKWAKGEVTVASSPVMSGFKYINGTTSPVNAYVFNVSGLNFKPTLIVAYMGTAERTFIYIDYPDLNYLNKTMQFAQLTASTAAVTSLMLKYENSSAGTSITSTGWTLPILHPGLVMWAAYEKFFI